MREMMTWTGPKEIFDALVRDAMAHRKHTWHEAGDVWDEKAEKRFIKSLNDRKMIPISDNDREGIAKNFKPTL